MTATLECWVLPHERAPGAHNMAKDEAILDFVSSHPDQAVFRTYEWAEPTLSLGYFQSIRSAEAEARWNGMPSPVESWRRSVSSRKRPPESA